MFHRILGSGIVNSTMSRYLKVLVVTTWMDAMLNEEKFGKQL